MQTAVGVFGGGNYTDEISGSPLMVEGAGHSGRQAISSLNCPPFLALEACRERLVFLSQRTRITHEQFFVKKYIMMLSSFTLVILNSLFVTVAAITYSAYFVLTSKFNTPM
jgi:hypothetical protein